MSDPIMQKLDEMQARCDAATEGPWESDGGEITQHWSRPEPWKQVVSGHIACMAYCYGGSCWPIEREADSDFITASRADMPRLVTALKAVLELTNEAEEERRAAGPAWDMRQDGAAALADYIEQAIEEALGVES